MELIVAKTSSELGLKVKLSISNHDILEVFSALNYTSSVPNINARLCLRIETTLCYFIKVKSIKCK